MGAERNEVKDRNANKGFPLIKLMCCCVSKL